MADRCRLVLIHLLSLRAVNSLGISETPFLMNQECFFAPETFQFIAVFNSLFN